MEENLLVPMKLEEHADVRCCASEDGHWDLVVQGWGGGVVEQDTHMLEAEQPKVGWRVGSVHKAVGSAFDVAVTALTGVLMLVMCFRLPILDVQIAQNVFGFVADFHCSRVTNQFSWCTTISDDVQK